MPRYLWLRIALVVAVMAAAVWYLYPPRKAINLGLDLQGGIHLVLGVDVDKALENVVERAAADVRNTLQTKGLGAQVTRPGTTDVIVQLTSPQAFPEAQVVLKERPNLTIKTSNPSAGRFELTLTEKEAAVERAVGEIRAALQAKGIDAQVTRPGTTDLVVQLTSPQAFPEAQAVLRDLPNFTTKTSDPSAGRFELTLTEKEAARLRDFAVRQGVETIRNRVDQFGVAEPTIQRQGENRILVQLPGIQDPARAKALIGKTALLEFKMVDDQADTEKALKDGPPPGAEILYERRINRQTGAETKIPLVVKKRTLLTGDLIQNAEVRIGESGEPYVSVTFNTVGARVFGDLTEQNVGKRLAIVLDGNVHSAPVIRERIPSGQAQITGGFTAEEARDLAIVLRAGALPAPVQILEERTVGPSLGADSIRKGVMSTIAGGLVVVLFMLIYYRLSGLVADLALLLNLLILLACMAAFHATLTLPGIAGIVLTIGMAVDTNILIFERIREEFRLGKSVRAAIEAGFRRAFTTVIDTHVTVVVSAVILYQFGTGPVKGFAVSLMIGILASLFTAVFFTRLVFDLIYMGRRRLQTLSI